MHSVLSIFPAVEALLLPPACLGCERGVRPGADPLCDHCRLALHPIAPPACGRCGQTFDRWESGRAGKWESARCGFCHEWPASLERAASAVWFEEGPARSLVHALKYGGWKSAARPMAEVMAKQLKSVLADADLLVPVPLGRSRQRERGYNQAGLLAEALGERCGVEVAHDLLVRRRETRAQTGLHPRERGANVAGAFRLMRPFRGRAVLVDDVLTTGATLGSAAEALGGARALTFARAVKPD